MSPEDIADANFIESIREHARWQDPCEIIESDGLLLVAGHTKAPFPYRNCAARLDRRVPASDVLGRAQEFFRARGRGFSVLVRTSRDNDLEQLFLAAPLQRLTDGPCMFVEARLPDQAVPDGVRVERFIDERRVRDAVAINAEAYQALQFPASETRASFPIPSRLLSDRVTGFVAYRDDRPVSTAMTLHSDAGAGVYWVGTVNAAQRSGLAAICTRLATNAGFERGARVVTLQASPFGEPIYLRLGYRPYERARWYHHPKPR